MNQRQSEFLNKTVLAAQQSQRQTGVPASITIAQAILESGWGQSALARRANNFFGIKAIAQAMPVDYVEFLTTEFVNGKSRQELARFAKYQTPVECFAAHAGLLSSSPRYKPAMRVCGNPALFAWELQACGYSTNPEYAHQLSLLVAEFDLTQYDIPPEPPAQAQEEKAA